MTLLAMFHGIPIYESPHMVIDGEPYEVWRSWRERLFTRPWRPWRATRRVVPKIPDPNVLVGPMGKYVIAHPETARRIYERVERGEL